MIKFDDVDFIFFCCQQDYNTMIHTYKRRWNAWIREKRKEGEIGRV